MAALRTRQRLALGVGLLLPILVLAAGGPPKPDKGACKAAAAPSGASYFLSSEVDSLDLLPPPPAEDSDTQREDVQAVLAAQRAARAAGTTQHAIDDATPSCARFSDVLGDTLKSKPAEKAVAFLDQAALEGASVTSAPKKYWKRERPFMADAGVERLADVVPNARENAQLNAGKKDGGASNCAPPGPSGQPSGGPGGPGGPGNKAQTEEQKRAEEAKAEKELDFSSYPSGHSAYGTICSILLADIVPEKRAELFARGRDFGASRLVVGAHFPDDVENGRIAGTVAVALMMQNAKFQRDLDSARVQLRAALALPAEAPDLEPHKERAVPRDPDPAEPPAKP